jgi:hypothetical protein
VPKKPADRPVLRHEMLLEESDRGCVLIGGAALDNAMEGSLRAVFANEAAIVKKSVDPLLGPNGPMSSYWSKTQLLNALGLLPGASYRDLERIRRIRNRFAHVEEPVSFDDNQVKDLVSALENTEFFKEQIPRRQVGRSGSGRSSARALAEEGLVPFDRACFAWCVEALIRQLKELANRLQDRPKPDLANGEGQ